MCENAKGQREPPMCQTGLSRDEFVAIAEAVGNEVEADVGKGSKLEYKMEPYHPATTGQIRLFYVDHDEPTIIIESVPSIGSERGITLAAPASEWTVTNDVDDHNIITTIGMAQESGHTAELAFRGPPAKLTPEGITTEDSTPYPPLLND